MSSAELTLDPPDASLLVPPGTSNTTTIQATLRLGGFTCVQSGTIEAHVTITEAATPASGWNIAYDDVLSFTLAIGAYPGPSWSDSAPINVTLTAEETASENASYRLEATYDGRLPSTCQSLSAMPDASASGGINATTPAGPSDDPDGPGTGSPSTNGAPDGNGPENDAPALPVGLVAMGIVLAAVRMKRCLGKE